MLSSRSLALPISIVLAGALAGTGLFFGMRGRADAPVVPPSASSSPLERAPVSTDAGAALLPEPLADPAGYTALQEKATARSKLAIEAKRTTWVTKCWKPSVGANPAPARETFQVRLMFDGSGRRTNFSVAAPPAKSRADVATCIQENPPDVKIEPARTTVAIQTSFELP